MKIEHIKYLCCPTYSGELEVANIEKIEKDSIESGILRCFSCESKYNIIHHIPKFVPIENYSACFGFQWFKNSKTQYDSYSGINISEKRFFEESKWPRELIGQTN